MNPELEPLILQMLSEVTAIPAQEIRPEHTLGGDLGMDSVASMELLAMLDERFGIELELEDAEHITDVRSVLALAKQRVAHVG